MAKIQHCGSVRPEGRALQLDGVASGLSAVVVRVESSLGLLVLSHMSLEHELELCM